MSAGKADMSEEILLREDKREISVLKFNRPECLNALNYDLIDRLLSALDEIATCPSTRVVILSGVGDRAFSAGADIFGLASSIAKGTDVAVRDITQRGQRLTACIEAFPKPIIAAVNGLAYGAGCEITEAAPLAIASDRATFAKPEIRLGFPPPFGGTQRLPRHVGRKLAIEMILTGEPISAETAGRIGLVNRVVPHEHLMDEAEKLAQSIIESDPDTVSACLTAVTRGLNVSIGEGLAIEAIQFGALVGSEAVRRGTQRFIDGRRGGSRHLLSEKDRP